jgi:hypothetical protein
VVVDPTAELSGGFATLFTGTGDYRWAGSRVQIAATGTSALRYYAELDSIGTVSHTVAVGMNADLGGRTKLMVNQMAAYSPSYLYGVFPQDGVTEVGDVIPSAPEYDVSNSESYSYGTTLTLTRGLSRRNSISAMGELQYTDFARSTALRRDVNFQRAGLTFVRTMGRHSTMRIGYDYRTGQFGYDPFAGTEAGARSSENIIQVGAEYTRPISATRRMVVGFNLGSTAIDRPGAGRSYRFLGEGTANLQFARMWQGVANFQRTLEYVPGFTTPLFLTGVNGRIEGRVSRRLTVVTSSGYSSGESAIPGDTLTFRTYTASARLQQDLTRTLAAYVEYLYYFYDIQGTTQHTPFLLPTMERNSVRVGVTLWVPAFRR